jgi:glycosyltransferase involved in cell wall biosynthesis
LRIDIVSAALPPKLDGIGDYTAHLARELGRMCRVRVITAHGEHDPIEGVHIESAFTTGVPRSVYGLIPAIESDPPDCVLVQFNQFSYGRWGWNPYLPLALRKLRRRRPGIRQLVMMHEDFVPVINWKFAIMTTWQRWQFRALGRNADTVLFSIQPWAERYRSWFPGRQVVHLPVGSAIPNRGLARAEARKRLQIDEGTRVIGLFGTAHATRLLGLARATASEAARKGYKVLVLYIGPHGDIVRAALDGFEIIADGPLPAEEVSRRLAAVDLFLAPYLDGASTRRSAMMAGLQHGLATVGTNGPLTDEMLKEQDGRALLLADVARPEAFVQQAMRLLDDDALRSRIACEGQRLYLGEFDWPRIASRLLAVTGAACGAETAREPDRAAIHVR